MGVDDYQASTLFKERDSLTHITKARNNARGVLSGKTCLVTGGASGLGRALVTRMVAEGANVCFTYLHSADNAQKLQRELGEAVMGIKADASDWKLAHDVVSRTYDAFGSLEVLVNNAASSSGGAF